MAFFNKNTQTVTIQPKEDQAELQAPLDLTQLEASFHELVGKIKHTQDENEHLIQAQTKKLDELKSGLENIMIFRNGALSQINSGGVRDSEALKNLGKQAEEYNIKAREQQGLIDRIQLDISLLKQEKDQAAIDELLEKWKLYETKMFGEFISPMETEITDIKDKYFSYLKELRHMYTSLEKLALLLNEVLPDGEKLYIHSWFNAVQLKPELQITKYDQDKEDAILNTYRAE